MKRKLSNRIVLVNIGLMVATLIPVSVAANISNIKESSSSGIEIAQSDRRRRIQFAPNTSSAQVKDAAIAGTRDIYVLKARAGQTTTIIEPIRRLKTGGFGLRAKVIF